MRFLKNLFLKIYNFVSLFVWDHLETLSLEVEVIGATEENKDQICDSIADALGGSPTHCSFVGPQSGRRRLTGETTLYMDVAVSDASSAQSQASRSDFVGSLSGLPAEVTVTSVSIADAGDWLFFWKNMIFNS